MTDTPTAYLDAIFACMTEGVVYHDHTGSIRHWNPSAERILGLTGDQLTGRTSHDPRWLAIREDGSPFPGAEHPAVVTIRTGPVLSDVTMGIQKPDGSLTWLLVNSRPLAIDGEPHGALVTFIDVTERQRIAAALRNSEARYRGLFRSSPDGVVIVGTDGRIVESNECQQRMFRAKGDELIGLPAPELIAPEDRERARQTMQRRLSGEYIPAVEYTLLRRDGTTFAGETTAAILYDAAGAVNGYICVTRDTSERFALQTELQQAQKMEAVGRLAGGVAHDFNNLLGAVLGNAEMALLALPPDSTARQDVEEIIAAANRAAGVTAQLLAFARKQPSRPTTLDLNQTVEWMLKLLGRLIGEDIVLEWKPQATAWPITADPVQVDQVLANLAVNARDAMAGTGTLTVATSTRRVTPATAFEALPLGDYVVLSVQDTGTGMSPEVLQRAFEPFFTTKASGKGTGLGLSIVYGIARQHGGIVEIESEVGRGTTVSVWFPRATGESATSILAPTATDTARGAETVMVVEDSDMLRALATRALSAQGYHVIAADTPARAIELAASHDGPIHLLLTDVVMPGMNGRELQRTLEPRHAGLKTLFMSGYPADVVSQQGALDPETPFLQKPFSVQGLATAVRQALDR